MPKKNNDSLNEHATAKPTAIHPTLEEQLIAALRPSEGAIRLARRVKDDTTIPEAALMIDAEVAPLVDALRKIYSEVSKPCDQGSVDRIWHESREALLAWAARRGVGS